MSRRKRGRPKVPRCIRAGCGKPAFSRGLCSADYAAARRSVLKGKTTWEELLEHGRIAPPGAIGRPPGEHSRRINRLLGKENPPEPGTYTPPAERKKRNARHKVQRHVKSGKMKRPDSCEWCHRKPPKTRSGAPGIQAHHFRGYDDPLAVIWLCASCHRKAHRAPQKADCA